MTDEPSNYAAEVECAIGLNVGNGASAEGVHAARDAVLGVRDREMEQLRARLDAAEKLHQAHLRVEQRLAREQLAATAAIERTEAIATRWEKYGSTDLRTAARILRSEVLDQAQQPTANPAAAVEVRQPCPYCADHQMIPRRQYVEHVARLHPAEQQQPTV